jgi:hypothetical protein
MLGSTRHWCTTQGPYRTAESVLGDVRGIGKHLLDLQLFAVMLYILRSGPRAVLIQI